MIGSPDEELTLDEPRTNRRIVLALGIPALVLAPMDGITDAPMRALQGEHGAFTFAVTEFVRISTTALPKKVFVRDVPELATGGQTLTGLPVQVQLLGGDPEKMAASAYAAYEAGASAIDVNFGCPAPTVNRNDGGATLLKHPLRIRAVMEAIRAALPTAIPVSAKLRLGWDTRDAIHENAAMAAEGGASWLTIHARTRVQGYTPPVFWSPIGQVQRRLGLPVMANGDIWSFDDFRRCRDESQACHYMIGRGALANPALSHRIARELGLPHGSESFDWIPLLESLVQHTIPFRDRVESRVVARMKQWLKLASNYGDFQHFDAIKHCSKPDEFFAALRHALKAT